MKTVGLEMGRIIILFPFEEIRPAKGLYAPVAIKALQERYGFLQIPDMSRPLTELERDGYIFGNGRAKIDGEYVTIRDLGFYSDGISITCLDTADTSQVLDDVLAWSQDALGTRAFIREPRRIYRSQLIAEFDRELSGLIGNFSAMANVVSQAMARTIPHELPINMVRLAIGMDQTKIPGLAPVPFVIERKTAAPFETERYFCEAPLPTRTHIETLERLEASL